MVTVHIYHPRTGALAKDWRQWESMASHRTGCWVNITDKMVVVYSPAQVTCKKCLKTMAQKEA